MKHFSFLTFWAVITGLMFSAAVQAQKIYDFSQSPWDTLIFSDTSGAKYSYSVKGSSDSADLYFWFSSDSSDGCVYSSEDKGLVISAVGNTQGINATEAKNTVYYTFGSDDVGYMSVYIKNGANTKSYVKNSNNKAVSGTNGASAQEEKNYCVTSGKDVTDSKGNECFYITKNSSKDDTAPSATLYALAVQTAGESDSITLDIGATGYATLYPYANLDISSKVDGIEKLRYVSGIASDGALTFTDLVPGNEGGDTVAPGFTGYLVKGTAGTTVKIPMATAAVEVKSGSDNYLRGVCTSRTVKSDTDGAAIYMLAAKDGVAVWKKVSAEGHTAEIGKAYLEVPTGTLSGSRNFDLLYLDGAALTKVGKAADSGLASAGSVYNLSGERVTDGFKGVVIKDGKKYLTIKK